MFVDTSVFIAILKEEPETFAFSEKMERTWSIHTSVFVVHEAVSVQTRLNAGGRDKPFKEEHFDAAVGIVNEIINDYDIRVMSIDSNVARIALEALKRYGRGSGHRAKLNMGDCFSYACAKAHNLPLLFKGNDFIHTDVKQA